MEVTLIEPDHRTTDAVKTFDPSYRDSVPSTNLEFIKRDKLIKTMVESARDFADSLQTPEVTSNILIPRKKEKDIRQKRWVDVSEQFSSSIQELSGVRNINEQEVAYGLSFLRLLTLPTSQENRVTSVGREQMVNAMSVVKEDMIEKGKHAIVSRPLSDVLGLELKSGSSKARLDSIENAILKKLELQNVNSSPSVDRNVAFQKVISK